MISQNMYIYAAKQDALINKKVGWEYNPLKGYLDQLAHKGMAEVGWRESCGVTDPTMYVHRGWLKVIAKLEKDGLIIAKERMKHGNSWATKGGGFWNSITYKLEKGGNKND